MSLGPLSPRVRVATFYELSDILVVRNLEIIGEAAKNLSPEFRQKHATIDWKRIAGFRDRLIHEYFGINLEIVWSVVKDELPTLKGQIEQLLLQK